MKYINTRNVFFAFTTLFFGPGLLLLYLSMVSKYTGKQVEVILHGFIQITNANTTEGLGAALFSFVFFAQVATALIYIPLYFVTVLACCQ